MKKSIKILSCLISAVVATSIFAGCGKDTSNSGGKKSKEINVWTSYDNDDFKYVKKMTEDWAKDACYKVNISKKTGFDDLVNASKGKSCPDIVIGIPNDHLGSFVRGNIIDEVKSGILDDSDYIDAALEASNVNGKRYGIPLTLETYVLFYNKKLVPTAPKTWDEFMTMAKKVGFNYDLSDFYYSSSLIQANGGYVLKNNNGTVDVNDIGMNNEGAIKGFEMINEFAKQKIISASVTGDIARGNFQNGKIGMTLSGPWDVANFKKAGVDFGAATIPQINGKAVPTTCGVKLAVVPKNAKNKDGAWEFGKWLAKNAPYKLFKQTAAIPVLKAEQEKDEIKNDPITSVFAEQSKSAVPMSVAPEFGTVWETAKNNIKSMITGKETPKQAGDNIVKQMQEKIKAMK